MRVVIRSTGKSKHRDYFEALIFSHPVQLLNWIGGGNTCIPCKNQEQTIRKIVNNIDSSSVGFETIEKKDYNREFKKFGNKALPSLNVFVNGAPMMFVDTKLNLGKKPTRIKPSRALAGSRDETTLINIIYESLEKL
jgi:hypothetical protein